MDNEASSSEQRFKAVEYNNQIYQIPVRRIDHDQYLFLNDVQAIVPQATALTASDKLIPFEADPITHMDLMPKRIGVTDFDSAWQVHVPGAAVDSQQRIADMDTKLERLSRQLHHVLSAITTSPGTSNNVVTATTMDDTTTSESNEHEEDVTHDQQVTTPPRPQSPPPAFSSSPPLPVPSNRPSPPDHSSVTSTAATAEGASASQTSNTPMPPQPSTSTRHVEGDAPPSYETSILGNIKALTDQLRLYESHIANRHKSPRWLARRSEWVQREPASIEQVAYQLVQLEMALLWTAVSESWIQERETWLTLVASARTERHLAAAMLNMERHTLVMDESWGHHVRESWVNELLEMIVLPLTHGN
ncbi:hypothetical protein K492DRAFT_173053 [Lichtheimia hyalospora FSU 10163]|nr:hypothetical protein K492DRAFT_173053 [Lichtheimia hyalospora FSU 10163]